MKKLLVFCLDALCSVDVEQILSLPNMGSIFSEGSYVLHAEPVYPSLTYPCHISILTGNYVKHHGIPHNEKVKPGRINQPWYNQRSDITCNTLLDEAKYHGYSTCSISWPVTGGANFDLNMPMIVPINYDGPDPGQYFIGNATDELLEKYYDRYFHHLVGKNRSLDRYTMALTRDIIRDYQQPDVMLVKMCDLDSVRHQYGVYSQEAKDQLKIHDEQFGLIMDGIRNHGDIENTNFVVLGDHGQTDVFRAVNLNALLKEHGFIEVDSDGNLIDFSAYCHSASLSAWVQLKDPEDKITKAKVFDFLSKLKKENKYNIGYVYTREEARSEFNLTGPFDFIVEGSEPIIFNNSLKDNRIETTPEYPGYGFVKASHGALPSVEETTAFLASGPGIKKGVKIDRRSIVDFAPTMAALLDFSLSNVDGHIIEEIVR